MGKPKFRLAAGGLLKALRPWLILLFTGVTWGFSFSLSKIAATGGTHPFGITFLQCTVGAVLLSAVAASRRSIIVVDRELIVFCLACGLLGLAIPSIAFYYAASHVAPGVLAIGVAIVPILTYLFAAVCGLERFDPVKVAGVVFGAISIILLVAPKESLPDRSQVPWVILAFGSAACYAALNIILALRTLKNASTFIVTCGMFVAAAVIMLAIVLSTDSFVPLWPLRTTLLAAVGLGIISTICYCLYIYLLDQAGPVFTSQTANVITLAGVAWGIVIFGDSHSIWIWLSLAMIMIGLALVRPREKKP